MKTYIVFIPVILVFCLAVRLLIYNPFSPDSWLHLGMGRFVVEHHTVPTHTDISYKDVQPSLELIDHSWGTDLLLNLATAYDPLIGVITLLIPLYVLTLYLVYQLLRPFEATAQMTSIMLTIVGLLCLVFWTFHPIVIAVPLTLVIILVYQARKFWMLPLLFVVFANMAGGYILVPILYLFTAGIMDLVGGRYTTSQSLILIGSLLASVGATLLNPYGVRIWVYGAILIAMVRNPVWYSTLPMSLFVINQNYNKNAPSSLLYAIFFIYLSCLLIGLIISAVRKPSQTYTQYKRLIPLLILLLPAYFWVRWIPLATAATAPLVLQLLRRIPRGIRQGIWWVVSIGVCVLAIFPPQPARYDWPQVQTRIIKEDHLPANVLTTYDLTGYAYYQLYPARVLADVQDDIFDDNRLIEVYSQATSVPEDFFQQITTQLSINTALVSKDIGGIAVTLNRNHDWSMNYLDSNGFIFTKSIAVDPHYVQTHSIRGLNLDTNLGVDLNQIATATAQLERFTDAHPESMLALGQLATMYRVQKQYAKAEATLARIPQEKWDFIVMTEMARIKAAQGVCKTSEEWFLKALDERNEKNYSRAVLDLGVLYAGCLHDMARAKHYFARYNSFALDQPEREKLLQIAKLFGVDMSQN